jgi:hypothetical protein
LRIAAESESAWAAPPQMHEAYSTLPHAAPARARTGQSMPRLCAPCLHVAWRMASHAFSADARSALHCGLGAAVAVQAARSAVLRFACGAANRMLRAPTCDGSTLCARAPARFGRVFHAHAWARVLPYQMYPSVRMCHYPRASPRRKRRARAGPPSGSERRRLLRVSGLLAPPTGPPTNAMQCARHHHFRRRPPPRLSCC